LGTLSAVADEEWLDAEAAARHLDLPTRLVYAMVRNGQLTALLFPVRIRRRDLEGCLERCRIRPGDLAHLDPNAGRRGGLREAPLTRRGTPDRRFGRRTACPPSTPPGESAKVLATDRREGPADGGD
jgi:hypothetical protein